MKAVRKWCAMRSNLLDKYLLAKPFVRSIFEWIILGASGFCGYYFSVLVLPFHQYLIISGVILFILGMSVHGLSHKEHHQAHSEAENIEKKVVTTGIYSKIRHPGYLGLILAYFGIAFWFHSLIPVIVVIFLLVLHVLAALKEEKYLLKKFGREYGEYMRRAPWRFIPKVF